MDDNNLQTNTATILTTEDSFADALAVVPVEVRDFMWSKQFDTILQAIGDEFVLTTEQRDAVRMITLYTLVGTITPEERQARLTNAHIKESIQESILTAINNEIISRALSQLEFYDGFDLENISNTANVPDLTLPELEAPHGSSTANAPSPADVLARLNQKIKQPTVLAPTTRDYSVEKPIVAPSAPIKPSADPYREHVERE